LQLTEKKDIQGYNLKNSSTIVKQFSTSRNFNLF